MVNQNSSSLITKKRPSWWHHVDIPRLNTNSVLEAKILRKTPRSLYLDLGQYGIGIVWGAEFSRSAKYIEELKENDVVHVKVLNPENEFGMVDVALQDNPQDNQYRWIKDLMNNNQTIVGKVVSANRGGLLIKLMTFRAFCQLPKCQKNIFLELKGVIKKKFLRRLKN